MRGPWIPLALLLSLPCCGARSQTWKLEPSPQPKPDKEFNLLWSSTDVNGLPLNPFWGPQPDRLPPLHPECSAKPNHADCTDEETSLDLPRGFRGVLCSFLDTEIHGHVNWKVTSHTGFASWMHLAEDSDLNFHFEPDDLKSGLTGNNKKIGGDASRPYIALEFDSFETLERLTTTWWSEFRGLVREWADGRNGSQRIQAKLNPDDPGRPVRAVVIGLFGLDCEHECRSEVHPVYALALEVDSRPEHNQWVMFARNWGDEGFCSSANHQLLAPDNMLRLMLPSRGAGPPRIVNAESEYARTDGSPLPHLDFESGAGVAVTFCLPEPASAAVSELVVVLDWSGSPPATRAAPSAPPVVASLTRDEVAAALLERREGEGLLRQILGEARRAPPPTPGREPAAATLMDLSARALTLPPTEAADARSLTIGTFDAQSRPCASARHARARGPDLPAVRESREREERAAVRRLCAAYGGRLPGVSPAESEKICVAAG